MVGAVSRTSTTMTVEGESLGEASVLRRVQQKVPSCFHFLTTRDSSSWGASVFGIDNIHELWLERSSTNKEAIHIVLRGQLLTVAASDRASIDNPS